MKRKFIASLLILTSLNFMASSQPPSTFKQSKADSLAGEGNIPEAITEYRKMLTTDPDDPHVLYNLASALSIDNSIIRQFDSCFKYLNMAVEHDTTMNSLIDPDFLPARDDPGWKVFENRLITMLNIKYNNPVGDTGYAKALWRLRAIDQAFFNEIGIAGKKLGMRSSVSSALWSAKLIMNRNCQLELGTLLNKKGWPRVKDVGEDAAMGAYLIVQHADAEMQRKYLPDVKRMCEEKELTWPQYALMYDRMCTNGKIPQRYGTHTVYNEKSGKAELYPIEDPELIDDRRREAGLEPLSDYLSKMGIVYVPVSNDR